MFDWIFRFVGIKKEKIDCTDVSFLSEQIVAELKRLLKSIEANEGEKEKEIILWNLNKRVEILKYECSHPDEAGARIEGYDVFSKTMRTINVLVHETARTSDPQKERTLKTLLVLSIQHMEEVEKQSVLAKKAKEAVPEKEVVPVYKLA